LMRSPWAHPRRPVGAPPAPDPQARPPPPLRRRQTPQARPRLPGRHLLRPAHRLPVESPGRHPVLPRLDRPRPLPGVGRRWLLPETVEGRPAGLRRPEGHRLVLAEQGRVHDQGPPRGGKRRAKTPPTAASGGPSAACWSMAPGCRWGWQGTGPTATTSSGSITPW
jgi:hypothetical protein